MGKGDGDGDGVTPRQGHVHVTCKSTSEPAGLGLGGDLLVAAEDGGPTHGRRATEHTDLSRTEICELEGRKKQRGGQGETELLEPRGMPAGTRTTTIRIQEFLLVLRTTTVL